MYHQSYCSALWNRLVNCRLRRLGPRPVPGDLVLLATRGGGRLGRKRQASALGVPGRQGYSAALRLRARRLRAEAARMRAHGRGRAAEIRGPGWGGVQG